MADLENGLWAGAEKNAPAPSIHFQWVTAMTKGGSLTRYLLTYSASVNHTYIDICVVGVVVVEPGTGLPPRMLPL
jgi:hypothetical protein